MKRIIEIDLLKGIAVITMIIFHIPYLAYQMDIIPNNNLNSGILHFIARFTQLIFIMMVGVNLGVSYLNDNKKWKNKQKKRILKLGFTSMLITLLTYYAFPTKYVKFGILHFITCAIFIQSWMVHSVNLQLGFIFFILLLEINKNNIKPFFKKNIHPFISFILGIYNEKYNAIDHFPIIPVIILVCTGVIISHTIYKDRTEGYLKKDFPITKLGKHSFNIYVIHWFVLYFGLLFYKRYINEFI